MIKSVDRAVCRAHQWVVDLSQRRPKWWVMQCSIAMVLAEGARFVFSDHDGLDLFFFVIGALGAFLLFSWARSSAGFSIIRALGSMIAARVTMLTLFFGNVVHFAVMRSSFSAASLLAGLTVASVYYFAVCDEPAPPRRREKLAEAGA